MVDAWALEPQVNSIGVWLNDRGELFIWRVYSIGIFLLIEDFKTKAVHSRGSADRPHWSLPYQTASEGSNRFRWLLAREGPNQVRNAAPAIARNANPATYKCVHCDR
ncbi:hypothetical protein BH20ACI3_BH20ACI3_38460 [soil metagenome]